VPLSDLPFGGKKKTGRPSLMSQLTTRETPDPLADVDYLGDISGDCAVELSALGSALRKASEPAPDANAAGYRERAKSEADRFKLATDSEYWFAVCFRTREEKDAFLAASGLDRLGDKYLDGQAAATILGVGTGQDAHPQE